MPLEKNNAGLIILGASEFPQSKNFGLDTAFVEARNRVKAYFTDKNGVALQEERILDLFDKEEEYIEMDRKIWPFIEQLKSDEVPDLFIYYVGHGSFTSSGDFYLAIRSTWCKNPGLSSILFKSLTTTIASAAHNLRTFMILDCCFAGAALNNFQADIENLVGQQFADNYPQKGLSILCAASKNKPAVIIRDRNITMFTEGFEKALRGGDVNIKTRHLTLRQIHNLTYSYIRELNPGTDVRPEVVSPIQPKGDIADMPHFINYAFSNPKLDIQIKKNQIADEMMRNNIPDVRRLFIDFVRNFDLEEEHEQESIFLGSECSDLEEMKEKTPEYIAIRNSLYTRILNIIRKIYNKLTKGDE